jgi:hypothetical protein
VLDFVTLWYRKPIGREIAWKYLVIRLGTDRKKVIAN